MASNGIYAVERGKDAVAVMGSSVIDISSDPAAGGFFTTDFKKNERLKAMLDSNKDGLKLEAMKLIIGMIAKGRDASDLFPAVVKNVVSKNIEVKKLVYVYLVRYAEEQQDLALLSISTFQRALKDPNQLIRASALRVLSSIRVPVIVPIMMLAIKDAVNDMSPYVRKTAAHAIPKLYSLDPEQKDQLIEVIEKLLSDKTTLVVGSAAMAFEEVCPERMDLLHKNYRKLCTLLVDVEEWGQTVILGMLTRYTRSQFLDPNRNNKKAEEEKTNKAPNNEDEDESDGGDKEEINLPKQLDPDHRLLLRNCKPLLQSRNAAVVMAVAKIFVYLAPSDEVNIVAKALIRLIHSHREIQSIVLSNIVTLTQMKKKRSMFAPYLKSFFVRSSDPTHIKLLKLDILTNLASPPNVSIILKEFQTYISCSDMKFVGATIQAIGTCACSIKDVSDTCLNGLVSLLSNRNETIVAESVVVIKKLLQMQPLEHKDIIKHMARLFENLAVPMAKASILWLVGEYSDQVPRRAPDVLRKVARTFASEEPIVKLQALNLAAKLLLTNPQQTRLLVQYVFNLAKYDQNYDIRDRARFLRHLLLDDSASPLAKYAKKIILAPKPAPVLTRDKVADQGHFQLGSLSHYLRTRAHGYQDLPDFPTEAPDPSVRNVPEALATTAPPPWTSDSLGFYRKGGSHSGSTGRPSHHLDGYEGGNQLLAPGQTSFYSDDEKSDGESSSATEDSEEDEETESEASGKKSHASLETEEESSEEEGSSEEEPASDSSDSSASSIEKKPLPKKKPQLPAKKETSKPSQDLLLLDLDDFSQSQDQQGGAGSGVNQVPLIPLAPSAGSFVPTAIAPQVVPAKYVPSHHQELLSRPGGLIVSFRFTRTANLYSNTLTNIELQFQNHGTQPVESIAVENTESGGVSVRGFPALGTLMPGATFTAAIGVDYNESTQPAKFAIIADGRTHSVTIKAPIGELIRPLIVSETEYMREQAKLRGLTENTVTVELAPTFGDIPSLTSKVYEIANVMEVTSLETNILRFAGQTLASASLVLITLRPQFPKASITINCEKMIIGSMLLKELKDALMQS